MKSTKRSFDSCKTILQVPGDKGGDRQRNSLESASTRSLVTSSPSTRYSWQPVDVSPTSNAPSHVVGQYNNASLCYRSVSQQLREQVPMCLSGCGKEPQSSNQNEQYTSFHSRQTADQTLRTMATLTRTSSASILQGRPAKSSVRNCTASSSSSPLISSRQKPGHVVSSNCDAIIRLGNENAKSCIVPGTRGANEDEVIVMLGNEGVCLDTFFLFMAAYELRSEDDISIASQDTFDSIDYAKKRLLRSAGPISRASI